MHKARFDLGLQQFSVMIFLLIYNVYDSPAHVVQWLDHLGAICSSEMRAVCRWFEVQFEPRPGKARLPT